MTVVFELSDDGSAEGQYTDEFGLWSFRIIGDNEAEITGLNLNNEDIKELKIPSLVKGGNNEDLIVVGIASNAMKGKVECNADELYIPPTIRYIGFQAFYCCFPELKKISFGSGSVLTEIGNDAFSGCGTITIYVESDDDPTAGIINVQIPPFQKTKEIGISKGKGVKVVLTTDSPYTTAMFASLADADGKDINLGNYTYIDTLSNEEFASFFDIVGPTVQGSIKTFTVTIKPEVYEWSGYQDGYTFSLWPTRGGTAIQGGNVVLRPGESVVSPPEDKLPNYLHVVLPASVKSIGDRAFDRVQRLTIEDGSQLAFVGSRAFKMLNDSFEVTFPNTITELGFKPFNCCSGIKMDKGGVFELLPTGEIMKGGVLVCYVGTAENYSFPETVTSVLDFAFEGSPITSVTLRAGIEYGIYPFRNCKISSIDYGNATEIPDYIFGLTEMTNVIIPSQVEFIGVKSYFEIKGLETVVIEGGSKLTTISKYAFSNNESLLSVNFGSSSDGVVCDIEEGAFFFCNKLETVALDSFRINTISDYAFSKANSQNAIFHDPIRFNSESGILIPASVSSIGIGAFAHLHDAKNYVGADNTALGYGTVGRAAWQLTNDTGGYPVSFEKGSKIVEIGDIAFVKQYFSTIDLSNCTELVSIGDSAFRPERLETLMLPYESKITDFSAFGGYLQTYEYDRIGTAELKTVMYTDSGNPEIINGLVPASVIRASNLALFKELSFAEGSQLESLSAHSVNDASIKDAYVKMSGLIVDLSNCSKLDRVELYGTMTLPDGVYDIVKSKVESYTISNADSVILGNDGDKLVISQNTRAINRAALGGVEIVCEENDLFSLSGAEEPGMLIMKQGILVSIQKGVRNLSIGESSQLTEIAPGAFARSEIDGLTILKNIALPDAMFSGIGSSDLTVTIGSGVQYIGSEFSGDYSTISFLVSSGSENWNSLTSMGAVYLGYPTASGMVYTSAVIPGVNILGAGPMESGSGISMTLSGGYTLYDVEIDVRGGADVTKDATNIIVSKNGSETIILTLSLRNRQSGDNVNIVFDANGGSIDGQSSYILAISRGLSIIDSERRDAVRERYDFLGWMDPSGQAFDFSTSVNDDITLSARWSDIRDPRVIVSVQGGHVMYNGVPVTELTVEGEAKLSFVPYQSYEPIAWLVNGKPSGSALDDIVIKQDDVHNDVTLSVECRYYASSVKVPSVIDKDTPTYLDINKTVLAHSIGGTMNTDGMRWTGHSSVPLIVDDHIYVRVGAAIYKAESDTGYVVARTGSISTDAFYHHLSYGNGLIVDTMTGNVYDLNLEKVFTLDQRISVTGVEYSDGWFYTSGKKLYRFSADTDDVVGGIKPLTLVGTFPGKVFGSYGFSNSVFVDGYIYRITADGSQRGITAMCIAEGDDFGKTGAVNLPGISSYYLDDGWISYNKGHIYVTGYTHGLFGAVAAIGDDKIAYVGVDGLDFGTPGYYTFDGMNTFASEVVFIGDYAFVNVGQFHMMRVNPDGSLTSIANCPGTFTHGSIVVNDSRAADDEYSVYMIPYLTSTERMVTIHCYKDGDQWKLDRYATLHMPYNYNSQAVRSDSEGRLVWYNDSGQVFTYATPENNRFFFFIYDGTNARWYESYGSNPSKALEALGSDTATLTSSYTLDSVWGGKADGWSIYYMKKDIGGYQTSEPSKKNGWKTVESLYGIEVNYRHYYVLTNQEKVPSPGDVFSFATDGGVDTYSFADNIGDRSIVGKKMVKGTEDVVTIRFYDRGEEVKGSALIGIVGMDVKGSLPMVYRMGHIGYWVEAGSDEAVSSLIGTKYTEDKRYEMKWIEASVNYTISVDAVREGGQIFLNLTATRTKGSEDLPDAHILLVSTYDKGVVVNSYTDKLNMVDGTAHAKLGISQSHLVSAHVFIVNGTPAVGSFMNYGMSVFDPAG